MSGYHEITGREAVALLASDERALGSISAINTLLINKGIYTQQEFDQLLADWAQTEQVRANEVAKSLLDLSRAELSIARLVGRGLRNRDIALKLSIAENTVKRHLQAIFVKLNIESRQEIVMLYAGIIREAFESNAQPAETAGPSIAQFAMAATAL